MSADVTPDFTGWNGNPGSGFIVDAAKGAACTIRDHVRLDDIRLLDGSLKWTFSGPITSYRVIPAGQWFQGGIFDPILPGDDRYQWGAFDYFVAASYVQTGDDGMWGGWQA